MKIGKVSEIWRYPIKSMGGERVDSCPVGQTGLVGDRGWAIRDETAGEIRSGKKWPLLMQCHSSYREQPAVEKITHVDITLLDGIRVGSDQGDVNSILSEFLKTPVSLCAVQPASNKAFYKRNEPGSFIMSRLSRFGIFRPYINSLIHIAKLDGRVREMFSREAGEPIPDFSVIPSELFEYTSPPGTFFDAFPIHLLTTSSLEAMSRLNPAAAWNVRRFRPNFLIETMDGIEGLIESEWAGRTLRIGKVKLKCEIPAVRCGMTTHAQKGLPKDPSVLRTIVRDAKQNLGLYASVLNVGQVNLWDEVEVL